MKSSLILKINELTLKNIPYLFMIDYDQQNFVCEPLDLLNNHDLLFDFNGKKNYEKQHLPKKIQVQKFPIGYKDYKRKFDLVQENIKYGNSFLVNLTCPTKILLNVDLDEVFYQSRAKYKLYYKNSMVFFSPETFITIEAGEISSHPMKGTIDAAIPGAREIILNDKKEQAEHATIVDLIRNDISMVARNVHVKRYRYIEEIKTNHKVLYQVSSEIRGKLEKGWKQNFGDILFSLLPAGSISGAPKSKTLQVIVMAEGYKRGFYTGIAGIYDGNKIDTCVIIRYIEKQGNDYFYKSGGGITCFSKPLDEYNELIDKVYVPVY